MTEFLQSMNRGVIYGGKFYPMKEEEEIKITPASKKPNIGTITAGIGINLSDPIKVSVDYDWIIEQLDKKLGNCPEHVKKALLEIEQETVND